MDEVKMSGCFDFVTGWILSKPFVLRAYFPFWGLVIG